MEIPKKDVLQVYRGYFGAEISSVFVRIHQRVDNMSQLSASRVLPRQVQFVDSSGPASFIIQEVFLTVESV